MTLQVGMSRLVAVDPGGGERDFYVCIRGEDVTLERGRSSQSSARNHLRGRVTNVVPTGVLTKVFLDSPDSSSSRSSPVRRPMT